ncbi:MAG: glycosyltransferase family 39 protein [Elusimicrobia bacterium]|nr:glycosyltransferase family 39 protein [Elusimicrobiota bacterium]
MPASRAARRRDIVLVAAFTLAAFAPWLAKPYHMDEPFFLAIARHILQDPWHPLAFEFNWYGRSAPMAAINNTPPLLGYLLAAAWKLTGGGELAMRLALLPLDLCAAIGLYLLASRFLRRPLWPTLILVAAPAWLINLNHLMAEKLMAAFVFPCLYALVRGVDEGDDRWWWGSAGLACLAMLSKYNAVFIVAPAAAYAWRAGVPPRKIAAWLLLSVSGVALLAAASLLGDGRMFGAAWRVTADSRGFWWHAPSHKTRSLLAFAGGCGLVTAWWPVVVYRPRPWVWAAAAAASGLLFAPALDLGPVVRGVDRWTGALLAFGVLIGFWGLCAGQPRTRGAPLWVSWTAWTLLLQSLYWSVMARFMLFLLPPLVLGMAEALERRWTGRRLRGFYAASLAATLTLSVALSWVDYRYAVGQRQAAGEAARLLQSQGRRVWCSSHWGLQYYVELAGGRELDRAIGGWDAVRPGDVVVVTQAGANIQRPRHPVPARIRRWTLTHPLPLRLISGWTGEGAFYSSVMGFLPFSLSREPLEEFSFIEVL